MDNKSCTILTDETNLTEVLITNEEYEHILEIQQEVLSMITLDVQSQEILNKICKLAEALLPNSVSSLMLKDENTKLLNVKAAPSASDATWQALNELKPGPHSGSCGNAVHHAQPQYIINTFTDKRSIEFLKTAKAFNLCSCWSVPVKNEQDNTIGSFALSSFEHRSPAPFHKKLLKTGASLVSIVLKNEARKVELEDMLYKDELTQLKNKKMLEKELASKCLCTVIFLDINHFSYVNTAYGFAVGDEILKVVSKSLQELYRENVYRINADQFALKFNNKQNMKEIVKSIKQYFITKLIKVDNITMKLSFTYGGVSSDEDLLQRAALSIKKAKENGGGSKLHIFDEKTDSFSRRQEFIFMNTCIHNAFEENLFVPFFQGIYDNVQKKITKYEALVRIVSETGEVISPYKFLEVTKLSGLLPKLTKLMIDKTFQYMSQNQYNFSVNITEDDLNEHYLYEYINKKALKYHIEPSRVTLEILEGISSKGQKNNIKQLKILKHNGYKIAIDDFGAEYSNFERILDLDIDFIKIDAKYIKNIDTDKKSYEIVKSIVGFANTMYIITIAEFVHSELVQKIVEDLGIQYSQGFYFSEPQKEIS